MEITTSNEASGQTPGHRQTLITKTDRLRLMSILEDELLDNNCADALRKKLSESKEIQKTETPRDLVTMNTMFRGVFTENERLDSTAVKILTLTYPQREDIANGWISVMTPLGVELLGARKGDVVMWPELDGTAKKLLIDEIIFQPELSGDWQL